MTVDEVVGLRRRLSRVVEVDCIGGVRDVEVGELAFNFLTFWAASFVWIGRRAMANQSG